MTKTFALASLMATAGLFWGGDAAYAANCLNGLSDTTCDTGGGDVCQWSGLLLACEADRAGDTQGATMYGLLDTNGDYQVFGTDAAGTDFCCIESPNNGTDPEVLYLGGGSFDDTLAFRWTNSGGSITYNLTNPSGRSLTGSIVGFGGVDTITGSNTNLATYDEVLNGHDGDDTITAWGGDDVCLGGYGDDTIHGDAGDDYIDGGDGNDDLFGDDDVDEIRGGFGDDDIFGGDHNDILIGGRDNDTIEGGDGNDLLDGGRENDTLRGQVGDDVLIGGDDDDVLEGGDDDDVLCGGRDRDDLFGQGGDDTLWPGHGTSMPGDPDVVGAIVDGGAHDNLDSCAPALSPGCENNLDYANPGDQPPQCP